jgi:MraZ protein
MVNLTSNSGITMILYGQHRIKLDTQGRWPVPETFTPALAEGSIVTAGLDGCLWLYPAANWQALIERVSPHLALTDTTAREFARYMFGQAHPLELKTGRLELPASLCQASAISNEIIVIGMVDHLELWSPQRWQAQMARTDSAWEARLGALGV